MSDAAGGEAPRGFLATLLGVFVAPGDAFAAIARRPSFWAPLVAFAAVGAAFNAAWLHSIEPAEFARAQIEDAPIAQHLSPEERATGIAQQAAALRWTSWLGPVLFLPIGLVLIAAVSLFVFRFFYASEVTFQQSLSIVAWTFLAFTLVTLPLTLLVLHLKEDWTLDPRTALQANLTLFLDKASVPRAVYSIAESLDLLSAWVLSLLSIGYGAASGRRAGQAAVGVFAMWGVYVLVKAALAAVF